MTAEAIRCPNCKLYNPAGSRRCDCGWEFGKAATDQDYTVTLKPLDGIDGWLLIPAAGLVVSLVGYVLTTIVMLFPPKAPWSQVQPFPVFAIVVSAARIACLILVTVAFFGKKKRAPLFVMILLAAQPILTLAEALVMRQYASIWPGVGTPTEVVRSLIASVTAAVIWIPYFMQSERVDATFTG